MDIDKMINEALTRINRNITRTAVKLDWALCDKICNQYHGQIWDDVIYFRSGKRYVNFKYYGLHF